MKNQIIEKAYEVSPQTKKVMNCKMLNDRLGKLENTAGETVRI